MYCAEIFFYINNFDPIRPAEFRKNLDPAALPDPRVNPTHGQL